MSNSLGGLVCNVKKQNLYNIRNKLKERIILVFQGSKILQNTGSQNNPTPTVFNPLAAGKIDLRLLQFAQKLCK